MNPRLRKIIEACFENLAGILYENPLKCLGCWLIVFAASTSFIPGIMIDTSAVALLREKDPARFHYNAFREQFDENDMIIITVTSDTVFSRPFLKKLKTFQNDLKNRVPHLKEVTSLINARDTYGRDDELVVGELLESWPETPSDLEALKKRVFSNPLYPNVLISNDGKVTSVLIETQAVINDHIEDDELLAEFDSDIATGQNKTAVLQKPAPGSYFGEKQSRLVIAAINQVIREYDGQDFKISMAGDPVVLDVYNRAMEIDIVKVVLLSLLTIAVFLALLFRRASGVILPEVIIISALLSTAGLISFFHVTIKLTTVVLPGFLLAVSVGYAVHILSIFYIQYQAGKSKKEAIIKAMGYCGLSVVLTALTTAASLLSFAFAELTAIADLGLFGASGVLLALFYTIVLIPTCIALFPVQRISMARVKKKSMVMDRVLLGSCSLSIHHPWKIVAGALILFAVSIYYMFQISYSHNVLNWIAKTQKVKSDVPYIDQTMHGSIVLELLLDTGKADGVKDPAFLNRIEVFTQEIQTFSNENLFVGKVFSINDIIKEIHKSLFNNDPTNYVIPKNLPAISQELLLFENSGSDDLERFTDRNYRIARISIKTPWTDAMYLKDFIAYAEDLLGKMFPDIDSKIVTGIPALMSRSIPASLHSMAKSYVIAFVLITGLMIIHVGNVKIGLLSMISNLLPIFMTMGIMGAFQIKLDMSTIMIGSIAIGIVVDDTLHFMYNFGKYYDETGNASFAIEKTMLGTGRALLLTSVILSSGFFILMTASLSLLIVFGFLTGITIIFALLADFIVNPALMFLAAGHGKVMERPSKGNMDTPKVAFITSDDPTHGLGETK